MSGELAEHHDELRAVARDLLARTLPGAPVDGTPDAADWDLLAESGWLGLEVPESLDGSGATFAEVAVILEEMGRAATTSPYLATVALAVGALGAAEPGPAGDDLLRRIATGRARVGVALADGALDDVVPSPAFRLEPSADGLRLHGRADFVPDAPAATDLLVVATSRGAGPVLVRLAPDAPGVVVAEQPVLDVTRSFGSVAADGTVVDEGAVLALPGGAEATARLHDRAALAVAFDSLGVARAMLDATVDYVKARRQFDRPIGSFQAVKHACADMAVEVAVVEELVSSAVDALVSDGPAVGVAVSMAKARSSDAAVEVAGKAMQLHGGIGYTWESGIHVYLKRAALDRSLFGSPRAHRRRVAARYGGAAVTPR